jgi:flagellin
MIINHNMNAINAHRNMMGNIAKSGKSMEKLSSGLRINRAGDDAAGLAISEKMRGQIRGLDQAARNSQDGISMIQTAEGALNETHSILQRMKELSTQAANDTNTSEDRGQIQKEMNQLTSEINRIGNTTEFNTQKLLDGGKHAMKLSGEKLTNGEAEVAAEAATQKFTIGGKEITVTAGTNNEKGNAIEIEFKKADGDPAAAWNGNKLTITLSNNTKTKNIDTTVNTAIQNATGTVPSGITKTEIKLSGLDGTENDLSSVTMPSVANLEGGLAHADATKATGTIKFDNETLAEAGQTITAGDTTYELIDSSSAKHKTATAGNVAIDIKGMTKNSEIVKALADGTKAGADTKLTVDSTDTTGNTLKIEAATAGVTGNDLAIKTNQSDDFTATLQIGANQGQAFGIEINDMRSEALGISGKTAGANAEEGAKFAKLEVTNGTDNTPAEAALDVSNHDNATNAIKVLDNAINTVSTERSKLGAYQNRLEHTINNLGTASENLTAAESRVRDVDMAKEMMNFSKKNILSQAAQAMLAQANQQPQGVLQLLR